MVPFYRFVVRVSARIVLGKAIEEKIPPIFDPEALEGRLPLPQRLGFLK
jgi:hypothetical protein